MNEPQSVSRVTLPSTARAPVQRRVAPDSSWATLPADRSFKVLQPSRTPAQLSLFPPPGLNPRNGR
ncbi:hypothetical protein LRS03_18130 [Rhizobacter sp. J219]|jgi:hypothetical protein|uniref:hypothetical protein n=1 Tax=Rhizobacter sp. J219 TaxID=2898430 RepID=UPI002151A9ED|nr:hypothetical protein [Rhizobacter sp. J219]MCR5884661.1 hypothetical protein [Rhizobacter sp. J219]